MKTKLKTKIKAGGSFFPNHNQALKNKIKVKTNVRAGDVYLQYPRGSNNRPNHNQSLKIKTKAGGIGMGNHAQSVR